MSPSRILGGRVVLLDGSIRRADLILLDGRIVDIAAPATVRREAPRPDDLDVSGRIVAPGLIDLQINGGWGHDFTADATSISDVARRLPETGVTSFLPTIVSSSRGRRDAALAHVVQPDIAGATAAQPLGMHFEGPLISKNRVGAHELANVAMPPADETDGWSRQAGIAMVTLAPEVPGALALVRQLVSRGVVVSIGHTACDHSDFASARDAGASMVTHLFNAMAPFSHRAPGPIGASFADRALVAGIICDGIHVDPVAIAMAWNSFGPDRLCLVTDAVAALASDAVHTRLADVDVTVDERGVRTADGVLAGSNLTLDQAVRNLVEFSGCTPGEAIRAATATPAAALGLSDRGRIEVGARADLVVLDDGLHPVHTIVGGTIAWRW